MRNTCQVEGCGRPTDLFACWRCVEQLGDDLDQVDELVQELQTTAARQSRNGVPTATRSAERPLPYKPEASEALWCLGNVAVVWARHVARDRGVALEWSSGARPDAPSVTVWASRWLAQRLALLRMCPEVGDAVDELRDAIRAARRVINRAPNLAYAGVCASCSTPARPSHLYAGADDDGRPIGDTVTCRACDAEWSYVETRAAMERDALDQLGTATEIVRAVPYLYGLEVNVDRVWKWASRGRIQVRGHSPSGRPMYRLGDVCELVKRVSLTTPNKGCQDA